MGRIGLILFSLLLVLCACVAFADRSRRSAARSRTTNQKAVVASACNGGDAADGMGADFCDSPTSLAVAMLDDPYSVALPDHPVVTSTVNVSNLTEFRAALADSTKINVTGNINAFDGLNGYTDLQIDGNGYQMGTLNFGNDDNRIWLRGGVYDSISLLTPSTPAQETQNFRVEGITIGTAGPGTRCFELRGKKIMVRDSTCDNVDEYCVWGEGGGTVDDTTRDLTLYNNTFHTTGAEACVRLTNVQRVAQIENYFGSDLKHVWRVHGTSDSVWVKWNYGFQRGFMVGTTIGETDVITEFTHERSEYHMKVLSQPGDDACFDYQQSTTTTLTVDDVDCYTDDYCAIPDEITNKEPEWVIINSDCFAQDLP